MLIATVFTILTLITLIVVIGLWIVIVRGVIKC